MEESTVRIRSTLTALLAAAAFALAGCSGGSETTDTGNDQNAAAQDVQENTGADDSASENSESEDSEKAEQNNAGTGDQAAIPETLAFQSKTVDGKSFDGATLAGKPTVMWFWAPWCPKCRAAAPSVEDAAQKFGDKVNIVGVAGLAERAEIEQFVDDYGLSGITNLADENDPLWSKFEVNVQHTYVVLDADGNQVHNGGIADSELTDKLTELTS
jgi:thiol-disulfide isomerase/thioredoxin